MLKKKTGSVDTNVKGKCMLKGKTTKMPEEDLGERTD